LPKVEQLTPSSRLLHKIDQYTSVPSATIFLVTVLTLAVIAGASLGFPSGWVTGFEVGTSALTLLMVTVIQHTQGREETATQRKLDELLRATPQAQTGLMMLEEESDETIQKVEETQRQSKLRREDRRGVPQR
jgi:low affinity Fe/Cu permease